MGKNKYQNIFLHQMEAILCTSPSSNSFKFVSFQNREAQWPHGVIVICSWARHLTLTVPPSSPGVQMGTDEFNAGGNPVME